MTQVLAAPDAPHRSSWLHPEDVEPILGMLIARDLARLAQDWFETLADETRIRILQALALAPEWCVGDLALALSLSVSALSHQLRYLRERGIVERRRAGRVVFYSLADGHVRHVLLDALAHVQEPAEAS